MGLPLLDASALQAYMNAMGEGDLDARVRMLAFDFLERQSQVHGEVLPRSILESGFDFEGTRVPLLGPQGIFKPKVLPEIPISITTAPIVEGKQRPYDDELNYDGMISYCYRGTDPDHRENVGLRLAWKRQIPLIYFAGVVPGKYMAFWPALIVGDDPASLTFTVAVDDKRMINLVGTPETPADEDRRRYVTQHTKVRLHQQEFRLRVLRAYQNRCAICRLRHQELLEAAHILPDWHPDGQPVLPNGLSLCQLHHGAFDRNILGIRPDLVIELRKDVLEETDGPMLEHGLQGFQGKKIWAPTKQDEKPDPERLEERYVMFKKAV